MSWLDLSKLKQPSKSETIVDPESTQSGDAILDLGTGVVLDLEFSEIGNDEEVFGVLSFLRLLVILLNLSLRDEETVVITS